MHFISAIISFLEEVEDLNIIIKTKKEERKIKMVMIEDKIYFNCFSLLFDYYYL